MNPRDSGTPPDPARNELADLRARDQDQDLEQLPRLLDIVGDVILCRGCRRGWRLPADGRLSAENREYLVEHVLGHTRRLSRHKPWMWRRY